MSAIIPRLGHVVTITAVTVTYDRVHTTQPVTETEDTEGVLAWVQLMSQRQQATILGKFPTATYQVWFQAGTTIKSGDKITVTAAPLDTSLVGKVFRVDGVEDWATYTVVMATLL